MDINKLKKLLGDIKSGKTSVSDGLETLKHLPYEDLGFAKIDHHRGLRNSVPEVVFALNKKKSNVAAIAKKMLKKSGRFLITKGNIEIFKALKLKQAKFYPNSGIISCGGSADKKGLVLIISAGTSDIPVAEEAKITAEFLGSKTEMLNDVGVAGIHRILKHREDLNTANAIIVAAGMEGALPSVVGGLTDKPVIAVPTSTGYGTSLGGLTALFAMLNSCVPGIAVVNIDNGFGAGCMAHKINISAKPTV